MIYSFTHYWSNRTWLGCECDGLSGRDLGYCAGKQFSAKISPGDQIFIVTVLNGILFVCCKIKVSSVCNAAKAAKVLNVNKSELYAFDQPDVMYALAENSSPMLFRRCMSTDDAKRLRLIGGSSISSLKINSGLIDRQTLRSVRRISDDSVRIFDKYV